MPRKGENIYRRKDNRWEGRYIVSYSTAGKAIYRSVYGKTYTEVKLKMKNRSGTEQAQNIAMPLTAWTEEFLNSQKDKVKIGTYKIYERYFTKHIQPFFYGVALRKVNKDMLQTFVNSLKPLAPSTVRGIFSFLCEVLKAAEKKDYIIPIRFDVELPKTKRNEPHAFTREEQKRIENALNICDNPNEIGILLCLYTGVRIGEVCGLKWEDIDFENELLHVRRTAQRVTVDGKSVLMELPSKSETSCRKIPIPACLLAKLKSAREESASDYVLSTCSHMMDTRTFQNMYKKILARADVRYANAHTMRHTFSVRALELGFDIKTLSEILGHSDASVTLKFYAHSLDEHKRNSMARFSQIM